MKKLIQIIQEKLVITKDTKEKHHYNYHPKTKDELKELVDIFIQVRGNDADLNDIDTSEITDMSKLFKYTDFNGDISKWDVSKVRDMREMFYGCQFFNGDISRWNVSNVENMYAMFRRSAFTGENGDISKWNVSKVKDMHEMFYRSPLENNPPKWYKK